MSNVHRGDRRDRREILFHLDSREMGRSGRARRNVATGRPTARAKALFFSAFSANSAVNLKLGATK